MTQVRAPLLEQPASTMAREMRHKDINPEREGERGKWIFRKTLRWKHLRSVASE